VSATPQYSVWDHLATVVALIGVSMPIFWLGFNLLGDELRDALDPRLRR